MGKTFEGVLDGRDLRIAIVVTRWNELITERLLSGANDGLTRHGVAEANIDVAWVPGAYELPIVAKRLAASKTYDAVICLGTIIRGATAHFDIVAGQAANGITRAALDTDVPVIFGVLTTDSIEQALERAGTKAGNKGFEAACVAIEMARLLAALPKA